MSKITLNEAITASYSYPERLTNPELTKEYLANMEELLLRVNKLLTELKIDKVTVTSGFRPSSVNSKIANAAKKSNHTICKAIDILDDKGQSLAKKICGDSFLDEALLVKYDLYLEHPSATIGKNTNWVHLQTTKTKSGKRIFQPLKRKLHVKKMDARKY